MQNEHNKHTKREQTLFLLKWLTFVSIVPGLLYEQYIEVVAQIEINLAILRYYTALSDKVIVLLLLPST